MPDKTLHWHTGQVTMQPRGAMLRDLRVRGTDGTDHLPLHTAPWVNTPQAAQYAGLMQGLSGEWPCVPFGLPHDHLPPDWPVVSGWDDPFAHGYAAHHDWTITATADALMAQITLPQTHPIKDMKRRISPRADGIDIDLWVTPRRDCQLPIGLHPVFRLPDTPQRMRLEVDGAQKVIAHPQDPSPDPSPVRPGAVSPCLSRVVAADGTPLDFSLLPRTEQSETRLLVTGATGRVTLTDQDTGSRHVLQYDAAQFPFVMLWVSNRGRSAVPWSNRHLALGVEPVRAAFDLGTAQSVARNPVSDLGTATAQDFQAGEVFHTTYAITVQPPLTAAPST